MGILDYQSFYLVGIKGVAMTALAQCLVDAGKKVTGSDVAEAFVTQPILDGLGLHINENFTATLPADIDCLVYTAAHQAQQNPQVLAARAQNLPILTQAEALASLFNQKKGIAVCGVGGKSTTSAMITWILVQLAADGILPKPSFAVGVGNIIGLNKTGQWNGDNDSAYFVAEADEYVTDPSAPSRSEAITPRFSFLQPFVTVCTNLSYDHPDVYRDFNHTQEVYQDFFRQIRSGGSLIVNADDSVLLALAQKVSREKNITLASFGENPVAQVRLLNFRAQPGLSQAQIQIEQQQFSLQLQLPGKFNMMNALAALAVCQRLNLPLSAAVAALQGFRSTLRRSQFVAEKNGISYYDDYAHHPNEIKQVVGAFREWYPSRRLIVAFQSHTYSRTKALFAEFVDAFAVANQLVMTDIFASAREAKDDSISSDLLCMEINKRYPYLEAKNVKNNQALAEYCRSQLQPGDVLLTIGAGDIYQVHQLLN